MKESSLESAAKTLATMFGWIAFKGSSRPGGSDQIFLRSGRGFGVEFKVKGNKQSKKQENDEESFKLSGVPYYLVYTIEEFKEALIIENDK